MNYHEAAVQVLEKIGGKENLILRRTLCDPSASGRKGREKHQKRRDRRDRGCQGRIHCPGTAPDYFRNRCCKPGV